MIISPPSSQIRGGEPIWRFLAQPTNSDDRCSERVVRRAAGSRHCRSASVQYFHEARLRERYAQWGREIRATT